MATRVTKKSLQVELDRVNGMLAAAEGRQLVLDYAACYGGYCLTTSAGSCRFTPRMPARELMLVLNGMALLRDLQQREAFA